VCPAAHSGGSTPAKINDHDRQLNEHNRRVVAGVNAHNPEAGRLAAGGTGVGRLRRVPRLAGMMLVPSAGRACEV
jgi:hypothetical protein